MSVARWVTSSELNALLEAEAEEFSFWHRRPPSARLIAEALRRRRERRVRNTTRSRAAR